MTQEQGSSNLDFSAIDTASSQQISIQGDQLGRDEEQKYASELRGELNRIFIWSLRIGAIILYSLIIVRFWHLAAPSTYRWLTDIEIQSMDKMLFSSAFGGFVFTYLRDSIFMKKQS